MANFKWVLFFMLYLMGLNVSAQGGFDEVAQAAGIDFVAVFSDPLAFSAQGGVGWFDYDNDGDQDLYLTGGAAPDGLFNNNGDGSFTEVTVIAGFSVMDTSVYTQGVVTGDIDNDGFREVFITTEDHNSNYLYYNNGDGTFTDISVSAGVFDGGNSASACFGDYNLDGLIDLYVANWCTDFTVFLENNEVDTIPTTQNYFYVNNGDLTFTESSVLLGVDNSDGCGLAPTFSDFDNDGDMDLLVGNDFGSLPGNSSNRLYENLYPIDVFQDVSNQTNMDAEMFSMGNAVGDYDENGLLDYYITNEANDGLFRNDGGSFSNQITTAGLEYPISPCLDEIEISLVFGWGCGFLDYNHDTYLDLFVANGDLYMTFPRPCIQECKLFENNQADGTFTDVSAQNGVDDDYVSRGAAIADYDNDGDLDILLGITDSVIGNKNVRLFKNTNVDGNWIKVDLEGVISNRDGFGARVEVMFEGRTLIREVDGGSSFNSHHSTIVHFGLGEAQMIDSLRIRWLSGTVDEFYQVSPNQRLNIVEGQSAVITEVIETQKPKAELSIYPNPVSDNRLEFSVQSSESGPFELLLRDVQGRIVQSLIGGVLVNGKKTGLFHLSSDISKGVYLVSAVSDSKIFATDLLIVN
jgi:hypothetical protein